MTHKAGFVNILGKPNAGKSTLLNALMGDKISIATAKAQTTRHRINAIANGDGYQIIFSDTPGILEPAYKLHEKMLTYVDEALQDADLILLVIDAADKISLLEAYPHFAKVVDRLSNMKSKVFVVINKVDLIKEEKLIEVTKFWKEQLPDAEFFEVSALLNNGVLPMLKIILDKIPEHPAYFDKDELSDRPLRFFVSEIIREKIFLNYKQEIPYSSQVEIESYKEGEFISHIRANIIVERDTQKSIIIGKGGSAIKQLGIDSRKDIEKFLGHQVHLELFVRVKPGWRNSESSLNRFGY
jgi:GTP-binding protein Era